MQNYRFSKCSENLFQADPLNRILGRGALFSAPAGFAQFLVDLKPVLRKSRLFQGEKKEKNSFRKALDSCRSCSLLSPDVWNDSKTPVPLWFPVQTSPSSSLAQVWSFWGRQCKTRDSAKNRVQNPSRASRAKTLLKWGMEVPSPFVQNQFYKPLGLVLPDSLSRATRTKHPLAARGWMLFENQFRLEKDGKRSNHWVILVNSIISAGKCGIPPLQCGCLGAEAASGPRCCTTLGELDTAAVENYHGPNKEIRGLGAGSE